MNAYRASARSGASVSRGQTPRRADGSVPEGFEAQCRLEWQNIVAQLAAAGMTLDNLVIHRTFLADRRHTDAESRRPQGDPRRSRARLHHRHLRPARRELPAIVMPGLVPGIHVDRSRCRVMWRARPQRRGRSPACIAPFLPFPSRPP
ncbi:MAG: hypothetical protein L6R19_07190 [Alphaproteobacteria bacterium]|nr:hypothetical protein [Alphaproteobacteria bacterium]